MHIGLQLGVLPFQRCKAPIQPEVESERNLLTPLALHSVPRFLPSGSDCESAGRMATATPTHASTRSRAIGSDFELRRLQLAWTERVTAAGSSCVSPSSAGLQTSATATGNLRHLPALLLLFRPFQPHLRAPDGSQHSVLPHVECPGTISGLERGSGPSNIHVPSNSAPICAYRNEANKPRIVDPPTCSLNADLLSPQCRAEQVYAARNPTWL